MNKKLIYVTMSLLVIFNFVLFFKLSTADTKGRMNIEEELKSDSIRLSLTKYYHTNNVENSLLNNNIRLDKRLKLTGIDNIDINLKTLIVSGPKLIVRSNETGCSACIENELKKIEKFGKIIGDTNIIVITTHSNIRKSIVFKQTNNITFKILTCRDLGLPFEKISQKPFLFMLDSNFTTQSFFIPEMSEAEVSQAYYAAIYKRYFKATSLDKTSDIHAL